MSLVFPSNPIYNETTYTGEKYWIWDGYRWRPAPEIGYIGSSGFRGTTGFQGSVGHQGSVGFQGSVGHQGSIGFQGSASFGGYQGSEGFMGSIGYQGSAGFKGSEGFQGSAGIAEVYYGDLEPAIKEDGVLWFNNATAIFSAWSNTANAWIGLNGGTTGRAGYTGSAGSVSDPFVPFNIQRLASFGTYTATTSDVGGLIAMTTSSGIVYVSSGFANGDNFTIYNNHNSSSIAIYPGSGVTIYLAGTSNTAGRTLASRGLATVLCVNAPATFVITGGGLY